MESRVLGSKAYEAQFLSLSPDINIFHLYFSWIGTKTSHSDVQFRKLNPGNLPICTSASGRSSHLALLETILDFSCYLTSL
jgi:hypothetical protein